MIFKLKKFPLERKMKTEDDAILVPPAPCRYSEKVLSSCVAYCLWIPSIFFGFHWYYLSLAAASGHRIGLLSHMAFYFTCHALFWVFRQTMLPWYHQCKPDGSQPNPTTGPDMTVSCLFHEQTAAYQSFYVLHVVLLAFMIFHWFVDLVFIAIALRMARRKRDVLFTAHWYIYPIVAALTLTLCLAYAFALGPKPL